MASERFLKAFNALTEAYFNGELRAGDCRACAVGNICKEASAITGIENQEWKSLFYTEKIKKKQKLKILGDSHLVLYNALTLIHYTGYSEEELAKVEYVFETTTKHHSQDYNKLTKQEVLEDQYNGLCAVIDVLLSFEEEERDGEGWKVKMKHPKLVNV